MGGGFTGTGVCEELQKRRCPPGQESMSTSPRFRFAKNVADAKLEKTRPALTFFERLLRIWTPVRTTLLTEMQNTTP